MVKKLYGTDPDQVPTNADLGSAAYVDTQNMPETRLTNQPLSAKFGAEGDVPTDLASTLDFMQISGSTFVQTGSDAQAFIKSNNYWNGAAHGFVDTGRGSTTIRLNENNAGQIWFETAPSGGVATLARMIIDQDGIIRKPYQPAFMAMKTTTQSNIQPTTTHTITFDNEVFDNNGDYNGNAIFTAPVTGKYQFNVNIRVATPDAGAGYYHTHVRTSNQIYGFNLQSLFFTSDPTYWSFHGSLLVDMDAGDTCYVSIYQHQGAQQADIQGSSECNFSGFLVA